jgi:L-aspartate oxidase
MVTENTFDVLIFGSGAAGLTLALRLPEYVRVAVLAKGTQSEGCTLYAQGGISAVTEETDTFESHIADTLDAGASLNNPDTVRFTIERAPAAIRWLVDLGVPFTRDSETSKYDNFHLTREGGHSTRRVVHAADATGRAMETTLLDAAHGRRNITLLEHHIAIDLITGHKLGLAHNRCVGAYVLNREKQRASAPAR